MDRSQSQEHTVKGSQPQSTTDYLQKEVLDIQSWVSTGKLVRCLRFMYAIGGLKARRYVTEQGVIRLLEDYLHSRYRRVIDDLSCDVETL